MVLLQSKDKDIIQCLAKHSEVAFIENGNQFTAVSKDKKLISTTTLENIFESNIFIGNLKSFSKVIKGITAPKISVIDPPQSKDEYCTSFEIVGSGGKGETINSTNFWDYDDVYVPNLGKPDAKILIESGIIQRFNKMIPIISPKTKERSNYQIVFKAKKEETIISFENTQHFASNDYSISLNGNESIFDCSIRTKSFKSIMPLDYTVHFHFEEALSHWISTTTFTVEHFIPLEKDLIYE
jgi:hypothetical protein